MFRIFEDYNGYPPGVKRAIVFTVLAWVWFYVCLKMIEGVSETYTISTRDIMIGASILVLLATMKHWARMICLLGNAMAILNTIVFMVGLIKYKLIVTLLGIDIVLMTLSCYYLVIKSTADFFKQYNMNPTEKGEHGESR